MSHTRAQRLYRRSGAAALTPGERIVKTYTLALDACATGNADLLQRALRLLDSSLRYDQTPELAQNLHQLYEYCSAAAQERNFSAAAAVLRPLLKNWRAVIQAAA